MGFHVSAARAGGLLCIFFVAACDHATAPAGGHDLSASVMDLGTTVDALPPVPVTIGVDHGTTVATLAPGFIGLSYEKGTLPTQLFSAGNAPLIALLQRLGPSLLRIGGNSVDETSWNGAGAGGVTGQIAPADVDRLAGFAKAAGWHVLYGVNMGSSATPTTATGDESAYAAQALGGALYGLEIGNEVDLYKGKYRPATYSFATFQGEWQAYAAAIRARVAGVTLTGPASASHFDTWTIPFAAAEGTQIALLTQHYYLANGMLPTSDIPKLLAPNPGLTPELTQLVTAASKAKISGGARLAECNSFYNGGAPNVSDSFASALWVIDFAFQVAAAGMNGINLHGGGSGPGYTPIANDASGKIIEARPEYYGLVLFTMAADGALRPTTVMPTGLSLSAYAVDASDGTTALVLVNKDAAQPVEATLEIGRALTSATALALTGPSLASTKGQLLGGATVAPDGSWHPAAPRSLPVTGERVVVEIAPASALLLRAK
jgi:hypothetical protein